MNNKPLTNCAQCKSEVDPLDLFPNSLCLPCHARKHEHDTPEELFQQITNGFGGK